MNSVSKQEKIRKVVSSFGYPWARYCWGGQRIKAGRGVSDKVHGGAIGRFAENLIRGFV